MGLPDKEKGDNGMSIGEHVVFKSNAVNGPAVFHLGIIDFLQNWTFMKKVERLFKIYVLRKDPDGLSVMKPDYYMIRFQKKMDLLFDKDVLQETGTPNDDGGDEDSTLLMTHFSKSSAKTELHARKRSSTFGGASALLPMGEMASNPLNNGSDEDEEVTITLRPEIASSSSSVLDTDANVSVHVDHRGEESDEESDGRSVANSISEV